MRAYYNDTDEACAFVLRTLIARGVIPVGDVDTRSITEVSPDDLRGYRQVHFFAGGGLWPLAARLAGWPDDKELWSGSCPCQPFSVAGKGRGTDDPRHLWPDMFRLIGAWRPVTVVGEQVAGKAGLGWFDGVSADMEGSDYACRAVDIPACAVNAPHIRQRLYWVARDLANPDGSRWASRGSPAEALGHTRSSIADGCGALVDAEGFGRGGRAHDEDGGWRQCTPADSGSRYRVLGHAEGVGRGEGRAEYELRSGRSAAPGTGRANHWHAAEWRTGVDGKTRRVKPGVRLLAHGVPRRVDLLRIGGNAIVLPLAVEVIKALIETES
jgi:DNA (cytosine-5)-methyltransferase 1